MPSRISDESESGPTSIGTSMKRKLPFELSDDSDKEEGSSNPECTSRKRIAEILASNQPMASSTVMGPTHPQIEEGPENDSSSSDSTIKLDSTEQRITIQDISIISKISNRTLTTEKDGEVTTVSTINGRLTNSLQNDTKDYSKPSTSKCGRSDVIKEKNNTTPQKRGANTSEGSAFPKSTSFSKKRKFSHSPVSSPNKTIKTSPTKERRMNNAFLKVMKDLFSSVFGSSTLRNLIKEETIKLAFIISGDQKYFYVIMKLLICFPKWYNIFRFCKKNNVDLDEKEVLELYSFLIRKGIVDVDFKNETIYNLLTSLDHSHVKSICEKFKVKSICEKYKVKSICEKSKEKSICEKSKVNPIPKGKEDMITALLKFCNTQSTLVNAKDLLLDEIQLKMGKCVKLKESFREAFHKVFLLGTFTNYGSFKIQDYLQNELHTKTVYPEYKVEDYVVFYSRNEFLSNENDERYRDAPHLKMFTAQSVYRSALSFACEKLRTKFSCQVKKWLKYLIEKFPVCHESGLWYYHLTWLYMIQLNSRNYEHSARFLIKILRKKRDFLSEVQLQMLGERGRQLKVSRKYKIDQFYHDLIVDLTPEPIVLEHFPRTTVNAKSIMSNESGRKRNNLALKYYIDRCGFMQRTDQSKFYSFFLGLDIQS
ncbi:hypothetical protein JTB14_019266 [Gonioctena quinquepunctata]|nr:hypothetical protein JTB14_019266 [Gonioctena quinquepunctata]